jgi:ubiquinone/menaquinone biosynthesis C-methylase UbiE
VTPVGPAAWSRRLGTLVSRADLAGWPRAVQERVLQQAYRLHAPVYDAASVVGEHVRHAAVVGLDARPGEVVVDVGCGTGLNLPSVSELVGEAGRVLAVEPNPQMLARARERMRRHGGPNVTFVRARADQLRAESCADAVLLCLVHDVVRSPDAVARVVALLRPGGRVVAAGPKWAPWWALPVNASAWLLNRPYVTSFEGFAEPWRHLGEQLPDLRVETLPGYAGGAYIARGTAPGANIPTGRWAR